MKELNSIATKILKAKYYPNTDFKEAEAGPKTSFLWRNILQAEDLLIHGIR